MEKKKIIDIFCVQKIWYTRIPFNHEKNSRYHKAYLKHKSYVQNKWIGENGSNNNLAFSILKKKTRLCIILLF